MVHDLELESVASFMDELYIGRIRNLGGGGSSIFNVALSIPFVFSMEKYMEAKISTNVSLFL